MRQLEQQLFDQVKEHRLTPSAVVVARSLVEELISSLRCARACVEQMHRLNNERDSNEEQHEEVFERFSAIIEDFNRQCTNVGEAVDSLSSCKLALYRTTANALQELLLEFQIAEEEFFLLSNIWMLVVGFFVFALAVSVILSTPQFWEFIDYIWDSFTCTDCSVLVRPRVTDNRFAESLLQTRIDLERVLPVRLL